MTMGTDADLDLPTLSQASGSDQPVREPPTKRRNFVGRGDHLSTTIFEPYRPCGLEELSANFLYDKALKGTRWVCHHSNLADSDPYRQGVSISLFAQLMKHVCDKFRSERIKAMLVPALYERIKIVVDELYPHFAVLDGGPLFRVTRGSRQLRASSLRPMNDVDLAVKAVVQWLRKEKDPLRGFMAAFCLEGLSYAGCVEEKLLRGYLGKVGHEAFLAAARQRLCQDASINLRDDTEGLFM